MGARCQSLRAPNKPWSSKIPGKMHARGHAGHTTVLLGPAKCLASTRKFKDSVALIVQAAEEVDSTIGRPMMVQEVRAVSGPPQNDGIQTVRQDAALDSQVGRNPDPSRGPTGSTTSCRAMVMDATLATDRRVAKVSLTGSVPTVERSIAPQRENETRQDGAWR